MDDDWDSGFPREILGETERFLMSTYGREEALEAAIHLMRFHWAKTDEGSQFWADIYARLSRIANEGH